MGSEEKRIKLDDFRLTDEEIEKLLNGNREWLENTGLQLMPMTNCKYLLPCGRCDKTGELCITQ